MAYHGYIPLMESFLKQFDRPTVLEVGVHTGITTFSLVQRLSLLKKPFLYFGVDVFIRPDVEQTIESMNLSKDEHLVYLEEENSLVCLPKLIDLGWKFDLILLDGDHNYYTVSRELPYIKNLMHEKTLLIADDYSGKHSGKDDYYADKDEYINNKLATQRSEANTEIGGVQKSGTNSAINEFLSNNPHLVITKDEQLMDNEPVVICGRSYVKELLETLGR